MATQPSQTARPGIVRIGSRASRLAQAQARQMQARVCAALGAPPQAADEVAPITLFSTAGDRILDRRLLEIGGKGLFTQEIEAALLGGDIDMAVHSLKDMPAEMPDGLVISATPEREDPRDAFISPRVESFDALPRGARLGTASLRRQTQSLHQRPDLEIVLLRGNIDTRLAKIDRGECDAAILALAGLNRLHLTERVRQAFELADRPTAPGQGALAIETRAEDADKPWIRAIDHEETRLCIAAERGALEALEGSCRTAVAAHAKLEHGRISLLVEALTPDGAERFRRQGLSAANEPAAWALGRKIGGDIRDEAGDRLLGPSAA